MDTKFGFNANVKVEVFSADGQLKDKREVHNAVTDYGVFFIMDNLVGGTQSKPTHMELGTGSALTSNKLQAYIASTRVALTTKTRTNKVITMVGDWAAGVGTNAAITEAGIFDNATANTASAFTYATFTAINKGAADTLKITWTLTGAN